MKNEKSLTRGNKLTKQKLNSVGTLQLGAQETPMTAPLNKDKRRVWVALFKDRLALVDLVK